MYFFYISNLVDLPDSFLGADISHGIVKPRHSNSEAVETFVSAIDSHNRCPGIGFGHSPVPLQHHDLGPDLVIDAFPLVSDFLNVVLKGESELNIILQLFINIKRILLS